MDDSIFLGGKSLKDEQTLESLAVGDSIQLFFKDLGTVQYTVNPWLSATALINFNEILVRRLFEVLHLFKTSASQSITLRESSTRGEKIFII